MTTKAAKANALRANLARELGVNVNTVAPRWVELLREGVIVELHIRRYRGRARLTLADMGLAGGNGAATDETLGGLLTLGEKKLLPPAMIGKLDTLDTLARRAVADAGYKTHWGTFVPCTAFDDLTKRLTAYRDRYMALGNEIADKHAEVVAAMRMQYRLAADKAYYRLTALDPAALNGMTADDFRAAFVNGVCGLIPSAEAIREALAFEVVLSYVPLPSMLAGDVRKAEAIAARNDRERKLAAMNEAVVSDARARKDALIDGFLRDVTTQTRGLLYEAATAVLESMETGGDLQSRSIVQLSKMVDRLNSLNFANDKDVAQMGQAITAALAKDGNGKRNAEALKKTLGQIATVTRSTLLNLGETPRAAGRMIGAAAKPTDVQVKTARQALGLRELGAAVDPAPVELRAEARRGRAL